MNIIAVDFDNTLALGNRPIKDLEPNLPLIKRLESSGCYIKIVTARGAKDKLSEEQKQERYHDSITQWLEKYGVPYNELSFNKEYAHLYIDDMTIGEHADFSTVKSEFTNNSIILTEQTCIKKCKTAKNEFAWYNKARQRGVAVPEVRFCNDELIITERIKNARKPNAEEIITIVNRFKNTGKINGAKFKTYIDNLQGFDIPKLIEHDATFYHGDLSTQNVLVARQAYCIDPQYKDVFGSYLIDAAKAAFSFYAYENDLNSSAMIWEEFPESIPFTVTEGMRVCKYRDYFQELQFLRKHLMV